MNERINELIEECTSVNDDLVYDGSDSYMKTTEYFDKEKFAELIVAEAFRAGMFYSAKKYAAVSKERFTDNDVALFLEMEADELSDDEIKEHFGVER